MWCECCHENHWILAAQILTNVGQFLSLIPLLGWWRGRNCPSCIRTCLKCSAGGCCWLESLNIKYSIIFLHLMFSWPDVCLFVDWVNVEDAGWPSVPGDSGSGAEFYRLTCGIYWEWCKGVSIMCPEDNTLWVSGRWFNLPPLGTFITRY